MRAAGCSRTGSPWALVPTLASRVRACRPYRAQTKGKVERLDRFIRENFFNSRDFSEGKQGK